MRGYYIFRKKIKKIIKKFIYESFNIGEEKLHDNDPLIHKGIIDSYRIVELTCFLEKTFDITIEDDEIIVDNFYSINSIVEFLSKKMKNIKSDNTHVKEKKIR